MMLRLETRQCEDVCVGCWIAALSTAAKFWRVSPTGRLKPLSCSRLSGGQAMIASEKRVLTDWDEKSDRGRLLFILLLLVDRITSSSMLE